MIDLNKIYNEDCLTFLKKLPDNFIDCCVTSPPYYGLRDYGVDGQIGLEETPELYVQKLVAVFSEVKRVLKKEGTLWLNLGDSYAGSGQGYGDTKTTNKGHTGSRERRKPQWRKSDPDNKRNGEWCNRNGLGYIPNLKPKDLIGIPWMVAFALRADGWYLRQDIIWHKPNPMPESVTDRCTKSHEYIFLLTKSARYYYDADAIKQPVVDATVLRMAQQIEKQKRSDRVPGKTNGTMKAVMRGFKTKPQISDNQHHGSSIGPGRNPRKGIDINGGNQASEHGIPAMALNGNGVTGHSGYFDSCGNLIGEGMANKKSVWTVPTMPFKEAHFATFPEDLIIPCIKAGSPENGIVIDPFSGAGTTALVSHKLNRKFLGCEINPEYIKISDKRLDPILRQKTIFQIL